MTEHPSETELNESFERIYNETYASVLHIAASGLHGKYHDMCDVIAETYAEFFMGLHGNFEAYRDAPMPILYRITKRRLARRYSLLTRLKEILPLMTQNENGEERSLLDAEAADLSESMNDAVFARDIFERINDGDPETAAIFELRYKQEYTVAEIAAQLGLPEHMVRNRLYRGLEELRKIYMEEENETEKRPV